MPDPSSPSPPADQPGQAGPYSLGGLLADLREIEWHRAQSDRLADESKAAGAPLLASVAAYKMILSAQYGQQGGERWKAMAARPGVDRVKTICIAHSGEFSARGLQTLCAAVALAADKTLDEFLKLDIERGARLLKAAVAPPPPAAATKGDTTLDDPLFGEEPWPTAQRLIGVAAAADALSPAIRSGLLTTDPHSPARLPGFVENAHGVSEAFNALALALYDEPPGLRTWFQEHADSLLVTYAWPREWHHSVVQPLMGIWNIFKGFWRTLPKTGTIDPRTHPLWPICDQEDCWANLSGSNIFFLESDRLPSPSCWRRGRNGWARDFMPISEHPPLLSEEVGPDGRLVRRDAGVPVEWLTALETYAKGLHQAVKAVLQEHATHDPARANHRDHEQGGPRQPTRNQVFISYSHDDKKWLDELCEHFKPFLRDGSITAWSDQEIAVGSEWFAKIRDALARTHVAVLLVTPSFLGSDFIHKHELGPILKEVRDGTMQLIWIPVEACTFDKTGLKDYQAVIPPDKPLATMRKANRDKAWVTICQEIEKAMKQE